MPLRFKSGKHGRGPRPAAGRRWPCRSDRARPRPIGRPACPRSPAACGWMGITVSPAALKARTALFPNLCRLRDAPTTATTRAMTSLYRADFTTRAPIAGPVQCRPVRRPLLTLLALAALTFTTGLGRQAITDADEAYYAEASREMLASSDWLTPRFNFTDRWQKPVLYYWLTAATYAVAGVTEGAARFGVGAGGRGPDAAHLVRSRGACALTRTAAWLAGAIVATSFGYFTMARSALPDLPLALLHHRHDRRRSARDRRWAPARCAGGSWPASPPGCGFLMKGPVAMAVPAWCCCRSGGWSADARPSWTGILAATAASRAGRAALVRRDVRRARRAVSRQLLPDRQPRTVHDRAVQRAAAALVLSRGDRRWTDALDRCSRSAPAAGAAARCGETAPGAVSPRIGACGCGRVVPTLLFMASVGQQPRYVLPVLPPLAILLARGDRSARRASRRRSLAWPTWATAALLLLLAGLLLRLRPVLDHRRAVGAVGGGGRDRGRRGAGRRSRRHRPMAGVAGGNGRRHDRRAAGSAVRGTRRPAPGTGRASWPGRCSTSVERPSRWDRTVSSCAIWSSTPGCGRTICSTRPPRCGFSSRPTACCWW